MAYPSDADLARFRELVATRYARYARVFPWRETRDPYAIVVSEIMLQQTQTERVLKKYGPFLEAFPAVGDLAAADLRDVVLLWSGLGYNRRAKALKATAERIIAEFGGRVPDDPAVLETFPGIGPATARSIPAFAYDVPTVFIETNIRRVFLHFFFPDREGVRDREILPLVEKTLDRGNPREWYYGLMDYGVYLKKLYPNPNRRSAHYAKQAPFENSTRQVRGRILALLAETEGLDGAELAAKSGFPRDRVAAALRGLEAEGMVSEEAGRYRIG